jgi:hypothetical protein
MRMLLVLVPLVGLASGCFLDEPRTLLVPDHPFGTPPAAPPVQAAYAPAATESAARVDSMGRTLLAANPQLGIKPIFVTAGRAEAEVFHRGTAEVIVTEGLVKLCRTDGQLAAILCLELGKMVSERAALAGPWKHRERQPIAPAPIGGDNGADRTELAELGKYHEADRRRNQRPAIQLPPDPQPLARGYLTKAGFDPRELDTVAPLLRSAEGNATLETQLKAPVPVRPWIASQEQ